MCRLCDGIRVKGLTPPPLTGRKYDPTSHVPVERKDAELKKWLMKRGTCTIDGSEGGKGGRGKRGERGGGAKDRSKELCDVKD